MSDTPTQVASCAPTSLGEHVLLQGGFGFPEILQGNRHGEIPFYKVSDMSAAENSTKLQFARNYVSRSISIKRGWRPVPPGATVFAKVGAALLLNRRRIVTQESLIDNNMMAAIPRDSVDSRWLYWWLQTVDFGLFVQPGALPSVNQRQLAVLKLPLFSLPEQRRIAEILDTLDDQIRITGQVIAKLKSVQMGLLSDLLAYGLSDLGVSRDPRRDPGQFTRTAAGLRPRTWRVGPLIRFCHLQRGFDITVSEQKPGPYPVVSSSGIRSYHDRYMVDAPGVVTGRKGLLGDVYFVDGPFWPHDTSLWVTDFCGNDPKFIALLLKHLKLERFDAATSVPTLNRNAVHPIIVAIPEPQEQSAIVNVVDVHNERLACEGEKLRKLVALKVGLMTDLLTGRVRVPVEAAS
ncbi:MAG: restriction endonuclease subunit S [Gammaproteobacteria bacterium]